MHRRRVAEAETRDCPLEGADRDIVERKRPLRIIHPLLHAMASVMVDCVSET
jgi:hypothetical protein